MIFKSNIKEKMKGAKKFLKFEINRLIPLVMLKNHAPPPQKKDVYLILVQFISFKTIKFKNKPAELFADMFSQMFSKTMFSS